MVPVRLQPCTLPAVLHVTGPALPPLPQVYIVHHTDCGMVTFTTPQLRQIVKERLGADDTTHYHEFRWVLGRGAATQWGGWGVGVGAGEGAGGIRCMCVQRRAASWCMCRNSVD